MLDQAGHIVVPLAIVLASIMGALASYGAMRLVARGFDANEHRTADLASSVIFRVASLHALILGLVFAQETALYRDLTADLVREATAVADVYFDLGRYGIDDLEKTQRTVADYAEAVVERDWPSLHIEGRLARESYLLWEAVYQRVLDLDPQSARQEELRRHMLEGIHGIAELRQRRTNAANSVIPTMFWIAAIGGLVFVSMPYFIYAPSAVNLALLVLFASFTGLVLATIYAFSDPFSPPGRLGPDPFEALLAGEIGQARTASGGADEP